MNTSYYRPSKNILIGGVLFLSLLFAPFAYAAISPCTLLVDDFSDYTSDPNSEINSMKYWTGGGEGLLEDDDISDPGIADPYPACHKITYQGVEHKWWASSLWDGLRPDIKTCLLRYTHVVFEVKGAVGGEDFCVGLQETNKKKYDLQLKASNFIKDGAITTEWKTVRIPLNKFIEKVGNPPEQPGVNLNIIQAIDFMFYVPESLSGIIYFTNLRFEGAKIDDFEDNIVEQNLLRHEYSTGAGGITSEDIVDPKNPNNRCHKLAWVNPSETENYWYTNTYFEPWNVSEPTDISLYTHLNMRLRGEDGGETFKIEFQEAIYGQPNPNKVELPSSNYITVSQDWQLVSIPLADFVGVNKNNMAALALLFNKGGDTGTGTIYIDDIYLAYDNQPPAIGGAASKTFYVDHINSFRIPGSDPEGDHLAYSAANLPVGVKLDPKNGLFTWKPAPGQKGPHAGVVLKATDGMYITEKNMTINVIDYTGFVKPQSKGPIKLDKAQKKLFVEGKEFKIQGVGYHPIPIGIDPSVDPFAVTDAIADRDFPILRDLRVNTIRTWDTINYVLLNDANSYNIKVCATFWVEPRLNFADPNIRTTILSNFKTFVNYYKDYPAILMWVLGNEVDYTNRYNTPNLIAWYSLANEMAEAAYLMEGENYHPVAISNSSLVDIGDVDLGTNDAALNYIDVWGMNAYKGYSFAYKNFVEESTWAHDYFEDYAVMSDKPLWISEYGIDSYRTTQFNTNGEPIGGETDAATQSTWAIKNTEEILNTLGLDVCLGGTLMAFADEWWKHGDKYNQSIGGYSSIGLGNDVHPDDFANEEYWGIFSIADNGDDPDILTRKEGLDDQHIRRSAYEDLRDQCFNKPPAIVSPASDVTFYVGENNGFYVIASDPNNDTLILSRDPSKGAIYQPPNANFALFSWTPSSGDVGDYPVTFSATENGTVYEGVKSGNKAITIHVVDLSPGDTEPPVAEAGGDITMPEGGLLVLNGSGSTDNVGILSYLWDLDYDGITFNSDAEGPIVVIDPTNPLYETFFAQPGVRTVALMVNDGAGKGPVIDTVTVTVTDIVERKNVPYGYNSIQEAVNAASSGDEVRVWGGEYGEDVAIKEGISLIGTHPYECVIKGSVLFNEANLASVTGFTVNYPEGGYFNLQNLYYPAPGLSLRRDAGVTVINSDDVMVKDCVIMPDLGKINYEGGYNPPLARYGKGIQIWNLYGKSYISPNIRNNLITNAETGIFMFSQAFGGEIWGSIQNNTLDNNTYGIIERMHKENPSICNNIITNTRDGVHITYANTSPGLLDSRVNNITANNFYSNSAMSNIWCDELQIPINPVEGNIYIDPLYSTNYEATAPECTNMGWRSP